jgi:hypothetical protein
MKHFLSFFAILSTISFAQDISWYNYSNSNGNSFKISTAEQLKGLAMLVNEGIADFKGKTITLESDIELTGNWTPIGKDSVAGKMFAGGFNGNYYSISGLSVEGAEAAGLFGYAPQGTINYLTVNASKIKGTKYAGVLAGVLQDGILTIAFADSITVISDDVARSGGLVGKGIINFGYATGNVSATVIGGKGGAYAGGLVGSGRISSSYATGNVSATLNGGKGGAYAGGLAGYAEYAEGLGSISDSYAKGNVSAIASYTDGEGEAYAGGLAGTATSISNSYATGNVSATANVPATSMADGIYYAYDGISYAGGLAGTATSISNSYATGNISAASDGVSTTSFSGGLVGKFRNAGKSSYSINNSYATGNASAISTTSHYGSYSYSGGLVGRLCDSYDGPKDYTMRINNSYAMGNISASSTARESYAGGILGFSYCLVEATSVYYNSAGANYAIGNENDNGILAKSISDLSKKATFSGWDFYLTWDILENSATPFLYASPKHVSELTVDIDYSTIPPTPIVKDGSKNLLYQSDYLMMYKGTSPDFKGVWIVSLLNQEPYIGMRYVAFSNSTPIRTSQIATGNIRVQAISNAIVLENLPKNAKVEVYNLQGKQIYSTHSENSKILRIQVQTKGLYVVKIGSERMRVAVK